MLCALLYVMAVWVMCLFLMVLQVGLQSVMVVFPGHTHMLLDTRY